MSRNDGRATSGIRGRLGEWVEALRDLGIRSSEPRPAGRRGSAGPSGRARTRGAPTTVLLVDAGGVLRWQAAGPVGRSGGRRRPGGRGAGGAGREVVAALEFDRLPPNGVVRYLERLDARFAAEPGLRSWRGGTSRPALPEDLPPRGRLLLLLHGTFSSASHLVAALRETEAGRAWFRRALAEYDDVLSFGHPTLSASPVLNAFELARAVGDTRAEIDVVAHSRGGLVARWWHEAFDRGGGRRRLVLVGSPLAGTSLAAPARLRATLDYLANVLDAVAGVGAVSTILVPAFAVLSGLARLVASLAHGAADLPLLDAGVALVPGLAAQSRAGNNPEILRLRSRARRPPSAYASVSSEFEPPEVGWRFWRLFQDPGGRLADLGADVLFDAPNDLVVDTGSMDDLADGLRVPPGRVVRYGPADGVTHAGYFARADTFGFLREALA